MADSTELPTVLVPYVVREPGAGELDFFLYLRPETNGVDVESVVFGAVRSRNTVISLQYLANIPGEYIAEKNIVERHYAARVCFAKRGAEVFTDHMKATLSEMTGTAWERLRVVGAFDALDHLGCTDEALFATRVPDSDVFDVAGQVVKRVRDLYVVNYDIPALLRRNAAGTDIAVMVLRTKLDYAPFFAMVSEIRQELIEKSLINPEMDLSRAVHVSRGPVEQLKDARDYLVTTSGEPIGIMASPFARYLASKGVDEAIVAGLAHYPIAAVRTDSGEREVNLAKATRMLSYAKAWDVIRSISTQIRIPR